MKPPFARDDLPRFGDLEAEYEILRELGRGGTAVVYLAREREVGRPVAIKIIRSNFVEDQDALARLGREARTVGRLRHPNIVMLYGTRRLGDRSLALIMQHIAGRTLKGEIKELGPLPFERIERVLEDVGRALAYAHFHRILHRDVKPENIYLDEETGIARLSDFGIARSIDPETNYTLPGVTIGTPAYMSPEQVDGAPLDARSDLYGLGLVGYEMLTGNSPWAGESLFSIIYKQKHELLPPLATLRPGIPANLERALEGALRKDPAERWANADDFLAALNGALTELPATVRGGPPPAFELDAPARTGLIPPGEAGEENATIQYRRPRDTGTPEEIWFPAPGDESAPRADAAVPPLPPAAVQVPAGEVLSAASVPADGPAPRWRPRRPVPLVLAAVALVAAAAVVALTHWLPLGGAEALGTGSDRDSAEPPALATGSLPTVVWAVFGDTLEGVAGDTLPLPLSARVVDADSRGVVGVQVSFRVGSGEGSIAPAGAVTDSAGVARTRWLPLSPGLHMAEAAVEGIEQTARFYALVRPRPAESLTAVSEVENRGQAGEVLTAPLVVRVLDDQGDPAASVEVRFAVRSGGGRIRPTTAFTAEDGTASAHWTLGSAARQEAAAAVTDLPAARIVFRAAVEAPPLTVRGGLVAGGTHSCMLSDSGTAYCWGGNDSGQLGDGTVSRRSSSPAAVAAREPLAAIAAGVGHTCAVAVSGKVYCWGSNSAGQLGDGTAVARREPAAVGLADRATAVFAGPAHSCALDGAERLSCWGQNGNGQLGDGTRTDRDTPARAGGERTFRAAVLGAGFTCALGTNGAVYCWGRNDGGELGDGGGPERADPGEVAGSHRYTGLAAGHRHVCGVSTDGEVFCWGQNGYGQLGNGSGVNSSRPVAVAAEATFSRVTAGTVHTCGLTRVGGAYCWGRNMYGQLGDGSTNDRNRPVEVTGGLRFISLVANGAHTCGVATDGTRYCWGFNLEGQLGDGTRTNQSRPVPVGQ